jgi:prophage DNA circulation protein
MTPQEIERTIAFILAHEARFEVRQDEIQGQIQELAEQNRTFSASLGSLTTNVETLTSNVATLTSTVETLTSTVGTLAENVAKVTADVGTLSSTADTLKDVSRDLLDHARWTDFRLGRLENPEG